MLIEFHMLKNFPASNLNRDDTGAPKTAMFGGTQRGRISSQSLKRSWRTSNLLKNEIGAENIGIRTRKLPEIVEKSLKKDGYSDEWISVIQKAVTGFGTKDGKENTKELQTAQIISYSPADIQAVVEMLKDKLKDCKNIIDVEKINAKDLQDIMKASVKRAVTLDMALFGRMVTSDAFADIEAAMQVAHAVGVNRVFMESDYFTAVDDLINSGDDEHGSGMIGDIDYNSSCYYIYASLDTDKLRNNMQYCENTDEIIRKAIPALVRTMVFTNPSGKQNSFAAHALPSAVLVECKNCLIPVSLANAYEKPVRADGNNGIIEESVKRLKDECLKIDNGYGIPVETRLWYTPEQKTFFDDPLTVNCKSLPELIELLPKV